MHNNDPAGNEPPPIASSSSGTGGPFLIRLSSLLKSVRSAMNASSNITVGGLSATSPDRTLSAACSSRGAKEYPRSQYRQRLRGRAVSYSALGCHFPDELLDALERLGLNSTAIDVVAEKGHVEFEELYCEMACIWIQLFYDFWCREQTQHEEDTVKIRNHGSFVDYVFHEEDLHETLQSDYTDFYFSLRPRLPDHFSDIFEKFLRFLEAKLEDIAHAQQEMGA